MPFSLIIPYVKNISVKDIVIKELSINRGLNVARLHNLVKSNGLNVTYHAVYQAVHELKAQKVLSQSGNEFSISKVYIEELKHFSKLLQENYSDSPNLNLTPNATKHLTFQSLNEGIIFMAKAAYSNIFGLVKNRTVYISLQHLWLIQTIRGIKYLSIAKTLMRLNKWKVIVRGNSAIDRKCMESYRNSFKADIKLGVNCAPFGNTVVFGDMIIESFIPKELMKRTEKVFNGSKGEISLDWIEEYTKLCYFDRYKINATITRNEELARKIAENIEEHFK